MSSRLRALLALIAASAACAAGIVARSSVDDDDTSPGKDAGSDATNRQPRLGRRAARRRRSHRRCCPLHRCCRRRRARPQHRPHNLLRREPLRRRAHALSANAHWTFAAATGTGQAGETRPSSQIETLGKTLGNLFSVGTDTGSEDGGTGLDDWTNNDKDP